MEDTNKEVETGAVVPVGKVCSKKLLEHTQILRQVQLKYTISPTMYK